MFTGLLWLVVAMTTSTGCGLLTDDDETSGTVVKAFDLQVGYCFNNPGESEVEQVTVVECTEAHEFEIFHAFQLEDGPYPGAESLDDLWIQGCLAHFEDFVGSTFDESSLDVRAIFPTMESWNELDDREVLCSVTAVDKSLRTSSAAGSGA